MNILELCEKELLKELEDDHILVVQTTATLRRPDVQDYYRLLMDMVNFKYEIEDRERASQDKPPITPTPVFSPTA